MSNFESGLSEGFAEGIGWILGAALITFLLHRFLR